MMSDDVEKVSHSENAGSFAPDSPTLTLHNPLETGFTNKALATSMPLFPRGFDGSKFVLKVPSENRETWITLLRYKFT
jgi:hypothetical protein